MSRGYINRRINSGWPSMIDPKIGSDVSALLDAGQDLRVSRFLFLCSVSDSSIRVSSAH